MANSLQNQVYIYSLGTFSFHNEEENKIFKKSVNLKGYKKRLQREKVKLKKEETDKKKLKIESKKINDGIKQVNEELKRLKVDLQEAFNKHVGVRELRISELTNNNVIGLFESVLTRTLDMETNKLSEKILVVQSYHEQVLEGLIKEGFKHGNHHYIYFSSSAGQIRQKKGIWVRKDLWDKHKNSLTCGLDIEDINNSTKKGCNINKYLSYKALINSSSEEWSDFNIDHCIVVDDLELTVNDEVDYINRDTFEIERKKMDVPLTVTDGVGMMLPTVSEKNFMVRLPWLKGLLAVYDFSKHGKFVTDVDGRVWDIEEEDVRIIFTTSQWKMKSYYNSWDEYKKKFKENNCQAAKLNEEEDEYNDGKLTYQTLQVFTDVTDEELSQIASSTINDIVQLGSNQEVMLKVLGATESNERKDNLQKSLLMYPELLNDPHSKETIKSKKRSLINDARTGRLNVNGSFNFIIPDLYSFSEFLFNGKPKSLLQKNEVYYKRHEEGRVAILRSPHLSREWGLKDNVHTEQMKEVFTTDAIYISNESLLSKLIQCDWDGDKVLVVSEHKDKTLLEVAQRNMDNDKIVPLYYEMEKANPSIITPQNIYKSLIYSFEANIGEISNNISKMWSDEKPDLELIKFACMVNNFEIDFGKTLFKLNTEKIDERLKKYVHARLPHFFQYDNRKIKKDKKGKVVKKTKVSEKNNSTINRLEDIIPTKNIYFRKVAGGTFDYKLLMNEKKIERDEKYKDIVEAYTYFDQNKKDLINIDTTSKKKTKLYVYKKIKDELLMINEDEKYVTDVLIEHLFSKNSPFKTTLWESFGDVILKNLEKNLEEAIDCEDCTTKTRVVKKRQVRCEGCQKKRDKEKTRLRMKKMRMKVSA
ncbi:hypothetical protein M3196_00010 [Fictibacillus nanhaiensis]|uniref:hypothetical protein n=1 Tax=Fictibacillus nanhaiensis TaxID=742169 RepID=UPI00203C447C|nr:hypothetical protein [Fictibacillus nanhaiensis]MCM3730052.1 hypothetical protein [Fictibacillus nanhaiensis]